MPACRLWRNLISLYLVAAAAACGQSASKSRAEVSGTTVATIATGAASCPDGGHVLSYGVDKNGNGVLDPNEIVGTLDICDGSSGVLTKLGSIAAGTQCSEGGVAVEMGSDSNGNGILDDSEVTTTDPICSFQGKITSVLGSLVIQNTQDLLAAADLETVSGQLILNLVGVTENVTLAKLTTVSEGLSIALTSYDDCIGPPFMNAATCAKRTMSPEESNAPSIALAFPALTTVGSYFDVNGSATLSAPLLQSVSGEFYCEDPNAILTSLTDMGGNLGCGDPNLIYQLRTMASVYPQADQVSFPNAISIGSINGDPRPYYGTLTLGNSNYTSVDLPRVTQIGGLNMYAVADSNVSVNMPLLSEVGTFTAYGYAYNNDVPGMVYDFNRVIVPNLTTVLGYARVDATRSAAYGSLISGLHTIGGALNFYGVSGAVDVTASALTSVGALDISQNSSLLSFAAPELSQIVAGDSNNTLYYGWLGAYSVYCGNNETRAACTSIFILNNSSLTSVNLGRLGPVPGVVFIETNPQLQTLDGLGSLGSIAGALEFSPSPNPISASVTASLVIQHTGLTSLPAMNLTSTAGAVVINNNQSLTDISGLQLAPGPTTSCPIIANSPELDYCAVKNLITAYNSQCAVPANAAAWNLANPCSGVVCAIPGQVCTINCASTSPVGFYDCL